MRVVGPSNGDHEEDESSSRADRPRLRSNIIITQARLVGLEIRQGMVLDAYEEAELHPSILTLYLYDCMVVIGFAYVEDRIIDMPAFRITNARTLMANKARERGSRFAE
jgi:hypothetical protein